jgi:hypothetical protein
MTDEPGEIYRTEDGFLAVRVLSQKKKPEVKEEVKEEIKPVKKKK